MRNQQPQEKHRGATPLGEDGQIKLWPMLKAAMVKHFPRRGALIAIGAVLMMLGMQQAAPIVWSYLDRPVQSVEVIGELRYLNDDELQHQLGGYVGTSFYQMNLSQMRRTVEAMPWVANATIERVWPGILKVRVEEQRPVAQFGADALLNEYGEIFVPAELPLVPLPRLSGPDYRSREILRTFVEIQSVLSAQQIDIYGLEYTARGAWALELAGNIRVDLGREAVMERLHRFVRVHNAYLRPRIAVIDSVDARYANGVAVKWKPGTLPEKESKSLGNS